MPSEPRCYLRLHHHVSVGLSYTPLLCLPFATCLTDKVSLVLGVGAEVLARRHAETERGVTGSNAKKRRVQARNEFQEAVGWLELARGCGHPVGLEPDTHVLGWVVNHQGDLAWWPMGGKREWVSGDEDDEHVARVLEVEEEGGRGGGGGTC